MDLLLVVILAVWTLGLVRVLGARATLADRTFATYLALGMLLELAVVPLIPKLVSPYGEQGDVEFVVTRLGHQAVLLAPVLLYLFRARAHLATSVTDAFLLGFATGFGGDLLRQLLAASVGRGGSLAVLPPWQMQAGGVAIAGHAYWTGLIALALAASLRWLPGRAAWLVTGLVALWVSAEQLALGAGRSALAGVAGTVTFGGAVTAWLALGGLVVLSVAEAQWVAGRRGGGRSTLDESAGLLKLLSAGRGRAYAAEAARLAARRQLELASAAWERDPHDRDRERIVRALETRVARPADGGDPADAGRAGHGTQAVLWVGLAVALALPALSPTLARYVWSLPLLYFPLPPFTLLTVVLAGVIVWRFLTSAARPHSTADPDDLVRFAGERALLWAALGLVLLVVAHASVSWLVVFRAWIAPFTGARVPTFGARPAGSLALLIAAALTGLTLARARRWRRAPIGERRLSVVRHSLGLLLALAFVWTSATAYQHTIPRMHGALGAQLFRWFGVNGNYAAALFVALLIAVGGYLLAGLLHRWMMRVEAFFGRDAAA